MQVAVEQKRVSGWKFNVNAVYAAWALIQSLIGVSYLDSVWGKTWLAIGVWLLLIACTSQICLTIRETK